MLKTKKLNQNHPCKSETRRGGGPPSDYRTSRGAPSQSRLCLNTPSSSLRTLRRSLPAVAGVRFSP